MRFEGVVSLITTEIVFGFGVDEHISAIPDLFRLIQQADRDRLDLFSLSDHPYLGGRLDAYAALGVLLGRTHHISGLVNVTNLPTRPAAVLARTVTSLSALCEGRVVLGLGAGGRWDRIADLGVPRLTPSEAVGAFEEAIGLIKSLSGGGAPITHEGRYYRVHEIEPAPVPAPAIWTGSVGPKSLAATGRVADGWIPGHAADWLSERYRSSRAVIDEAATKVGRHPSEIRTIYNFPGQITDRPLTTTRDESGRWLGGSVEQWIEELTGAVLHHQAAGFILFSAGHGPQNEHDLGRWAAEIAPAVRQAVAQSG
jgi:alkanesulfonate monooxygenase SsuD/methylene tetrahydromethanopterin reductase-like flavin-dependent oxidoreductase (luciferase family)